MELIFYIDSLYCRIEVAAYEKGFLLFDNFLPKFDQLVTASRASNLALSLHHLGKLDKRNYSTQTRKQ